MTANDRVQGILADLRDIRRTWAFVRHDRVATLALNTAILALERFARRVEALTDRPPPPGGMR